MTGSLLATTVARIVRGAGRPRAAPVTLILLCSYLAGWVITTIGLALIIGKLNDPVLPSLR